jgi:DeoR/GlpR family transcriptional regulator of sugar metabolism
MNKRNTQQRRRAIVDLLTQQGEVSVDELAMRFDTSEVTIRKDLTALEHTGLLLRKYGGAVPLPQELMTEAVVDRISARKQALAKAAASLIRDHYRIIIDSGSTTAALLPELSSKQGLVVMTNSLFIANSLRELEHEPK